MLLRGRKNVSTLVIISTNIPKVVPFVKENEKSPCYHFGQRDNELCSGVSMCNFCYRRAGADIVL